MFSIPQYQSISKLDEAQLDTLSLQACNSRISPRKAAKLAQDALTLGQISVMLYPNKPEQGVQCAHLSEILAMRGEVKGPGFIKGLKHLHDIYLLIGQEDLAEEILNTGRRIFFSQTGEDSTDRSFQSMLDEIPPPKGPLANIAKALASLEIIPSRMYAPVTDEVIDSYRNIQHPDPAKRQKALCTLSAWEMRIGPHAALSKVCFDNGVSIPEEPSPFEVVKALLALDQGSAQKAAALVLCGLHEGLRIHGYELLEKEDAVATLYFLEELIPWSRSHSKELSDAEMRAACHTASTFQWLMAYETFVSNMRAQKSNLDIEMGARAMHALCYLPSGSESEIEYIRSVSDRPILASISDHDNYARARLSMRADQYLLSHGAVEDVPRVVDKILELADSNREEFNELGERLSNALSSSRMALVALPVLAGQMERGTHAKRLMCLQTIERIPGQLETSLLLVARGIIGSIEHSWRAAAKPGMWKPRNKVEAKLSSFVDDKMIELYARRNVLDGIIKRQLEGNVYEIRHFIKKHPRNVMLMAELLPFISTLRRTDLIEDLKGVAEEWEKMPENRQAPSKEYAYLRRVIEDLGRMEYANG